MTLGIPVKHVNNYRIGRFALLTLGRIKAGNLNKVIALGPLKFLHLLPCTQASKDSHIILRIPEIDINDSSIVISRLYTMDLIPCSTRRA